MRIRRNGGEFEGLGLLRTFVGDPATAQWATVGEAPAPQLNDRSRSRPQRGNDRERLPPPSRNGYGEVAPHAYSGPGRTCSPRFSHVRTIFAPYSQAEISSEVV